MGLSNKPPPVVEAKMLCESAKDLKLKLNSFSVNIYFAFWSVQAKIILKLIKKYIFSKGEQFPLRC